MSDVFLSYAREDADRVEPLRKALEAEGLDVWWDQVIPAGTTWREHIESALNEVGCVIVVWTRHSVRSNWVVEEAGEAMERGILVPVFLDEVPPPLGFREVQAANLSKWRGKRSNADFRKFVKAVRSILRGVVMSPGPGRARPTPAAVSQMRMKKPRGGCGSLPLSIIGAAGIGTVVGAISYVLISGNRFDASETIDHIEQDRLHQALVYAGVLEGMVCAIWAWVVVRPLRRTLVFGTILGGGLGALTAAVPGKSTEEVGALVGTRALFGAALGLLLCLFYLWRRRRQFRKLGVTF